MQNIIGWDIGGAHLKAARAENGIIKDAIQIACPLWLGLLELERAFGEARATIGAAPLNAITMTGELSDAFATRAEGVAGVAAIAERLLSPDRAVFYAARSGFVDGSDASAHATDIGSANWHASAALAGVKLREALLIDMGSTTTDIIPVAGGAPASSGYTDAARLTHGELVYTGLVRTFLMAGPKQVPFAGQWTALMNEWFADMADVHRILGQLPPGSDMMDTSDGREKTAAASIARLARMIGRDAHEASDAAWTRLARFFAEAQLREIMDAAALILSRGVLDDEAPIIGAGIGRGVVSDLATRMGRPYVAFDELIEAAPNAHEKACDCAPASAVALIAAHHFKA
ncbi:Orf9, involved in biosynthesis of tetrahydromethanopterin. Essential for formaldehyde oxidation [Methylocella tundrae]|uniref:Orf9, involved in biosynthesis of tetrahydromethanopterin. Essential for formaldehyde oxidation n=1 Tax=Methylocella tundrae TaxID=227605 RepID=A0A8B6M056_METTU|nr:hydantoinase/oxoprolinase family protein [Methylocella tundrae]VTZ27751.1 Orf9, involved in biosynthesis of tetrahydromethanopterin. Essential for formaldehyde oxidation [Methylocella tundrae]VTZ48134.1 Orf9, involved in biosynthesis of tetrahydromethanopterin. Essential for formaldehyde oxidation [Methylocella tundrae]